MGQILSIRDELRVQRETFEEALHYDKRLDEESIIRFNNFTKEHPEALSWKDRDGGTLRMALFYYLSASLKRKDPLDHFRAMVRMPQTGDVFRMQTWYGWTLLHDACRYHPTSLEMISFVLEQCPDASRVWNRWNQTPLHIACIHRASLPVVKRLVAECPQAVLARDFAGQTPLHDRTCSGHASLDVIRFLAMKELAVCLAQDMDGDLPLDLAKYCKTNGKEGVIQFLTSVTTAAARVVTDELLEKDDNTATVAQPVVCSHNGPKEVAILKASLSKNKKNNREVFPLLQRDDVRSKIIAGIAA